MNEDKVLSQRAYIMHRHRRQRDDSQRKQGVGSWVEVDKVGEMGTTVTVNSKNEVKKLETLK